MSTFQPTRTIVVPSLYMGGIDAELIVGASGDGERASMSLNVTGRTLALAHDLRVAECGRWTWFDMPSTDVVATFGGFLAYALESSEEGARDAWPILTDDASEWVDALASFGEGWQADADDATEHVERCDVCSEPIDFCPGHGEIAADALGGTLRIWSDADGDWARLDGELIGPYDSADQLRADVAEDRS